MENKQPIERGGIVVREVNSEILIFLDSNRATRLDAIREARKILHREELREESRTSKLNYIDDHNDNYRELHNDGFDREF
jgi:hypothetical protein